LWLSIPGTPLDDGKLDVNESITLQQIIQHFDSCGSGFRVGVPAGAMLALGACIALGLPTAGKACIAMMAVAGAFHVSLALEGGSIRISGNIQNLGNHTGNEHNIHEFIDIAISGYQYARPPPWWCPNCGYCYYNVPAGIYIRSR